MDLTNEGVRLAVSFIVPGLIIFFIRSQFLTGRLSHTENTLTYLALSSIYYALTLPVMMLLVDDSAPKGVIWSLGWFCFLFAGPAFFGFFLGLWVQKGCGRWVMKKMGLNLVHAMPTSWDYLFSRPMSFTVLVRLTDGSEIAGLFGKNSFASSIPQDRDLYLEETFRFINKKWVKTDPKGVYIPAKEIKAIEVWGV